MFCFMQQRPYNSAFSMQILWIQCQSFQTNALKGSEEAEPSIPSNATVTDSTQVKFFTP